MHFFATGVFEGAGPHNHLQDIPVEPWRDELLKRGWPVSRGEPPGGDGAICIARAFRPAVGDVLALTGQRR